MMMDETPGHDMDAFDAAIPCSPLALPAHAHIPGMATEPDMAPLAQAKARASAVTTDQGWRDNHAYVYGFALMRAGFYWETHEVWEAVWLNCVPNSRERSLLRALIQTANARLKIVMGRPHAARRLRDEALRDLDEIAGCDVLMGVSVVKLRDALHTDADGPSEGGRGFR